MKEDHDTISGQDHIAGVITFGTLGKHHLEIYMRKKSLTERKIEKIKKRKKENIFRTYKDGQCPERDRDDTSLLNIVVVKYPTHVLPQHNPDHSIPFGSGY